MRVIKQSIRCRRAVNISFHARNSARDDVTRSKSIFLDAYTVPKLEGHLGLSS